MIEVRRPFGGLLRKAKALGRTFVCYGIPPYPGNIRQCAQDCFREGCLIVHPSATDKVRHLFVDGSAFGQETPIPLGDHGRLLKVISCKMISGWSVVVLSPVTTITAIGVKYLLWCLQCRQCTTGTFTLTVEQSLQFSPNLRISLLRVNLCLKSIILIFGNWFGN